MNGWEGTEKEKLSKNIETSESKIHMPKTLCGEKWKIKMWTIEINEKCVTVWSGRN